jgi:hypothetical protein
VADARLHPLDAGRLRWKQDHVVNRSEAGGGDECLDEPGPDHSVVGDGVAANRQSTRCGCSRADNDLVLPVGLTCPRSQIALVDERKKCVPTTSALSSNMLDSARPTVVLPAPGGPVTTISSATTPICRDSWSRSAAA